MTLLVVEKEKKLARLSALFMTWRKYLGQLERIKYQTKKVQKENILK